MGEDKSEKLDKIDARPALGDITNQPRKRAFSLVSSSPSTSKSGVGNKRPADSGSENNSHFWKQVALVTEKLEKDRTSRAKCPKASDESGLSPLKGGKIYHLRPPSDGGTSFNGNAQMSHPTVNHVVKEPPASALDHIDLDEAEGEGLPNATVAESRALSLIVAESSKDCQGNCLESGKDSQGEETRALDVVTQNNCTSESLLAKVGSSKLTESQDTGSFRIERCTGLKDDSCSNLPADFGLLKSCSCSFCTKAAYIWSDLHYQDVKGRISILMKSQKEASNLAQRYFGENEIGKHGQGNSSKVTHIESELTNQWKSLFLHMENVFGSETSELQTNFLALKDLREDFKTNLEMINAVPTDIQPCSSDASDHMLI